MLNFKNTLSLALVSDYWTLSRILNKKHDLSLVVGKVIVPYFELILKNKNIAYKMISIKSNENLIEIFLNEEDDLYSLEEYFFQIKSSRVFHMIYEPFSGGSDNQNEELSKKYLQDIESYFSDESDYIIRIPLGFGLVGNASGSSCKYLICDYRNETVLISDEDDVV